MATPSNNNDKKISQLTPVVNLLGTELVPVVQSGEVKRTTAGDIANLSSGVGSGSGIVSVNGQYGPAVVLTFSHVGAASAAQGSKADTALQPNSVATVAISGSYLDLANRPNLGTAAFQPTSAFASAAQGDKADTAVQPSSLATIAFTGAYSDLSGNPSLSPVATSGSYSDLLNKPTLGTAASKSVEFFASAAQGAKADTAIQPDSERLVPSGGSSGQVLRKNSSQDFDVSWQTLATGGGSGFVPVPATSTSSGQPGQYSADSQFFYICTSLNSWVRVPVSTF